MNSVTARSGRISLAVQYFCDPDELDPLMMDKPYWLEPWVDPKKGMNGLPSYLLLRDAIKRLGVVGIVHYTIRSRAHIGVLSVRNDMILLQQMFWPDEVVIPEYPCLQRPTETDPENAEAAAAVVESWIDAFNPDGCVDRYQQHARELIESRATGQQWQRPDQPAGLVSDGADLLARLEASIKQRNA